MKNLKKLTKNNLKQINGGGLCPPNPITSCDIWCGMTPLQKMRCLLYVDEGCECSI
ncbi:bacteriocin-like protein [Chryseobacterium herbae]|uniref:bacteriocin-like protein n=1 Tax=Chryseobacterium herbae TaxID=2976476 RepID=UPI003FA40780